MGPGTVVLADFPGVLGTKRRPAVVVSSDTYHKTRPDFVIGLITSNLSTALGPTDYVLKDWSAAGLHKPSAFRSFLVTLDPTRLVRELGVLSADDWKEVQARLRIALSII